MNEQEAAEFFDLAHDAGLDELETTYNQKVSRIEAQIAKGGPRPVLKRRESNLARLKEAYPLARNFFAGNSITKLISEGRDLVSEQKLSQAKRRLQKAEAIRGEFPNLPTKVLDDLDDFADILEDSPKPNRTTPPQPDPNSEVPTPAEDTSSIDSEPEVVEAVDHAEEHEETDIQLLDPALVIETPQNFTFEGPSQIFLSTYSSSTPATDADIYLQLLEGAGSILADGSLQIDGPGVFRVQAWVEQTDLHLAAEAQISFEVLAPLVDPLLSLDLPDIEYKEGLSVPLQAESHASPASIGEITYELTEGDGRIEGSLLHLNSAGRYSVVAHISKTNSHKSGSSKPVNFEAHEPAPIVVAEDASLDQEQEDTRLKDSLIDPELELSIDSVSSNGREITLKATSCSVPASSGRILYRVLSGNASVKGDVLHLHGDSSVEVIAGIEPTATHSKGVSSSLAVSSNYGLGLEASEESEEEPEVKEEDKIDPLLRMEIRDITFSKGLRIPLNALSTSDPPAKGTIHYTVESGPASIDENVLVVKHAGEIVTSAFIEGSDTHREGSTGDVYCTIRPAPIWPANTLKGWSIWTFGLMFHPRVVAAILATILGVILLKNTSQTGRPFQFNAARMAPSFNSSEMVVEKLKNADSKESLLELKPGIEDYMAAKPEDTTVKEMWNQKNLEHWSNIIQGLELEISNFTYDQNLIKLGQLNSKVRNLRYQVDSLGIEDLNSKVGDLENIWKERLKGLLPDSLKRN